MEIVGKQEWCCDKPVPSRSLCGKRVDVLWNEQNAKLQKQATSSVFKLFPFPCITFGLPGKFRWSWWIVKLVWSFVTSRDRGPYARFIFTSHLKAHRQLSWLPFQFKRAKKLD
jgi:hypothetical protein